jgi:hypothetical protein
MRFPRILFLFAWFVLIARPLLAQSTSANLNGLVSDPSSAAIGDAEVIAVSDVTGVQYVTKTNSEGIYVLPNLPAGPYRLQVSKSGFKTVIKPDILLNVQDALAINFTLPVGAAYEVLTVEGGAPLVNTESAAVSTVIDQTYVKNMPLNGRSFQDLILLTPGIETQSPQSFGAGELGGSGEFSVNGQRPEANYYTVDGVSANVGAIGPTGLMVLRASASGSVPASTALGTTQALVSIDALQEFRVQSSTYSAEYGRNPGGQFAFETKSGTKQWHGTAFDYLRNGFFDAQDWFNDYFGVQRPALRQNDFGGTFSGPVPIPGIPSPRQDTTFFFISYEGLRLSAPTAATPIEVPDPCMRGVAAQCPAGRQPAASALRSVINAFPATSVGGLDDAVNGFGQFIGSWSNPASLDSTSIRFDHVVNDKLRLFFRFSDTASSSVTRGSNNGRSPSVKTTSAYTMRTFTAGASSFFSNRLSNDFRFNYTSNDVTSSDAIDAFGGSTPTTITKLLGLGPGSGSLFFLLYGGYSPNFMEDGNPAAQKQWNFVDTASLARGRHQFKFGADYRRLAPFAIPTSPIVEYFFLSESAVENNTPFTFVQNTAPAYPLYANFSAFAQDEWSASPRLKVSFGLRWEVNPAPGVTQGPKPYALQGATPNTFGLAPQGTPLWQTTWHNLAPRLGVSYAISDKPGRQTVARGGVGVFYDTGQQLGSIGFLGPGFVIFGQFAPGSFPVPPVIPAIANPPVPPYVTVRALNEHLRLPYTFQWNAALEQALGKLQALTFSYVGAHSARLLKEDDIFPPNNPNMSEVRLVDNGLTSDYDALQVQFRRRVNHGATALASYTWSHCLDYGSQNILLGYQRASCDFDVRHNASLAFSYDLPNATQNRLLREVLNGWGVDNRFSVRTAFPITLAGTQLVDSNGQLYNAGLNLVPAQPIYLYGANCSSVLGRLGDLGPGKACPGGRAVNPQAFTTATSGTGNAPRNFVQGFGAWQIDLAVRREIPIYEHLKLQFRAEAFNVFNHPNFGAINPNFGQSTFGQATGTLANSSVGVLSSFYQMGGPRSLQFAAKFVF